MNPEILTSGDVVPEPSDIRWLLEEYFIGPIPEQCVVALHDELLSLLADPIRCGYATDFFYRKRIMNGFGHAWREELCDERHRLRNIDFAASCAFHRWEVYPRARGHCPARFVGTWLARRTRDQPESRWTFEANGRFQSDHFRVTERRCWGFHDQKDPLLHGRLFAYDEAHHSPDSGSWLSIVREPRSPDQIDLSINVNWKVYEIRLERVA